MINLLQKYPISEILTFIVLLALAFKGVVSFVDWANERVKIVFNKQHSKIDEKKQIENRLDQHDELILSIQEQQADMDKGMQSLGSKIDLLIASDMDDIRASITKDHHKFCYQKGWIDDFSLECIEKQYSHYVEEGGNSFIKGFMDELRALPKQDPKKI